ncbi:DUF500 domain-containing protein [Cordyceps javanica]|uniref:DUF500 domain-containing protein n=1 Tax=Cordyceps javanica TaxID=43265 RepID=A0A545VZY2_9HYPO|nr:DUF500 domain-containing protein [Cordyceps javanica]TQW07249.1 DUF500 domain protein [Cordyceps javanica]
MTATNLLLEKAPEAATNMDAHTPPTYAESVASEASHAKPGLNRQPSALSQPKRRETAAENTPHNDDKTRSGTFQDQFRSLSSKFGRPLNKAANVIGAEGWWPTSLEQECHKAARILSSFTSLRTLDPPSPQASAADGSRPLHPLGISGKSVMQIPDAVLARCAGLAVFTVLRAGAFHGSLAAGSGLVVARLPPGVGGGGGWSAPSAFAVSTVGVGFALGVDVCDCVCVLDTPAQVAAFMRPRVSLGGAASLAVGPVGAGAGVDAALSRTTTTAAPRRPVWSYVKSRGLWAGAQLDGTVVVERGEANAAFYGTRTPPARILAGEVPWPECEGTAALREVLEAVEGRRNPAPLRAQPPEAASQSTPATEEQRPEEQAAGDVAAQTAEQETAEEEKARLMASGY